MTRYIYLDTVQKRWHEKIFRRRHPGLVPGGACWPLADTDAAHLVDWCKNHVKDVYTIPQSPDNAITTPAFIYTLTKQECGNILKECRVLLEQRQDASDTCASEETAYVCKQLNKLITALEWCMENIRWLTANCRFCVENSPRYKIY